MQRRQFFLVEVAVMRLIFTKLQKIVGLPRRPRAPKSDIFS
jgi:hypothetical protein